MEYLSYSKKLLLGAAVVWIGASPVLADQAQCLASATNEGSFFSERTYTASDEYPSVTTQDAFKRIYVSVLKDGWRINQSDKDLGIISASQDVAGSNGKQTNLNFIVESLGAHGSKASVTFKIGFGQVAMGDTPKTLCGYLGAAEQ